MVAYQYVLSTVNTYVCANVHTYIHTYSVNGEHSHVLYCYQLSQTQKINISTKNKNVYFNPSKALFTECDNICSGRRNVI
jgi:hypothetical protein